VACLSRILDRTLGLGLAVGLHELGDQLLHVGAIFIGHGGVAGQHNTELHDLVGIGKTCRLYPEITTFQHRVAGDVAGENNPRKHAVVF